MNIKVDKSYDIPYLAGYSNDGRTIYIDRSMPSFLRVGHKKKINIVDFLLETHEHIEKELEDQGLDYSHAHKIATKHEHATAIKHGVSPTQYESALQPYEKMCYDKSSPKLPPDLDDNPYLDDPKYKEWFP